MSKKMSEKKVKKTFTDLMNFSQEGMSGSKSKVELVAFEKMWTALNDLANHFGVDFSFSSADKVDNQA